MLPTRCGKTVPSLKHGLNLKLSVQHIVGQETTSLLRCFRLAHRVKGPTQCSKSNSVRLKTHVPLRKQWSTPFVNL